MKEVGSTLIKIPRIYKKLLNTRAGDIGRY